MSQTIEIAFEITATCLQRCRIVDERFCEQSVIEGLKKGTLVTSTWINEDGQTTIDITATGDCVAIVESQQIDGDYENYR